MKLKNPVGKQTKKSSLIASQQRRQIWKKKGLRNEKCLDLLSLLWEFILPILFFRTLITRLWERQLGRKALLHYRQLQFAQIKCCTSFHFFQGRRQVLYLGLTVQSKMMKKRKRRQQLQLQHL
mmetsp:Transcript_15521/g.44824  ORF Transcript_15521/g.44824 Transcript_15521/m.44824 type:complete len:123 (-) Transcript_15521:1480-1848(-)